MRRIGVEIEFGSLSPQAAAEALVAAFGGRIARQETFRFWLEDTVFGGIRVELDTRFAHGDRPDEDATRTAMRESMVKAASGVIPSEIAVDPVPYPRLSELDRLPAVLRAAGAEDSSANPAYAFGLHLNPEAPSHQAEDLLAMLQAYLLRSGRLRSAIRPNLTRALLPFIKPFPEDYQTKVLRPDYRPDRRRLILDYCAANPTSFRGLDLLPLFAWLDPETVAEGLGGPHKASRPTYHYRLPNARLSDPGWTVSEEWRRWLSVERLAANRARLSRRLALEARRREAGGSWGQWSRKLSRALRA